jgi:hypothetical protein
MGQDAGKGRLDRYHQHRRDSFHRPRCVLADPFRLFPVGRLLPRHARRLDARLFGASLQVRRRRVFSSRGRYGRGSVVGRHRCILLAPCQPAPSSREFGAGTSPHKPLVFESPGGAGRVHPVRDPRPAAGSGHLSFGPFDLISSFFVLSGLLFYIAHLRLLNRAGIRAAACYAASLLSMTLAILTRESAYVFPALLMLTVAVHPGASRKDAVVLSAGPMPRARLGLPSKLPVLLPGFPQ